MPAIKVTTEHGREIVVNSDWVVTVEPAADGHAALHLAVERTSGHVIRVRETVDRVYELMKT